MKKGITPVIAVILLMLITIAMVGFAFVWFSRVVTIAGNATQQQLESQIATQAKRISIDNLDSVANKTTIRNIGSQIVLGSEIGLYVNKTLTPCTWTPASIAPGSISSCDWTSASIRCGTGNTVRVTAPGNTDEVQC